MENENGVHLLSGEAECLPEDCCLCSFASPDRSWDRLVIGDKIIRSVRMKSVEELRELVVHRYYRLNATTA